MLIRVVDGKGAGDRAGTYSGASSQLASSYVAQAQGNIESALAMALAATSKAPEFGFAWARVAELEFSLGRLPQAREALGKAMQFSPRNAQAVALHGFVLAGENKIAVADVLHKSIDTAIQDVSTQRAKLGAAQNQIEAAINSLSVSAENLSASESRIRDADIAAVTTELVSKQIMQQAGVSVLGQANSSSQVALSLLQRL